jgi:transcriptional regulator with XRE-family HTH domain
LRRLRGISQEELAHRVGVDVRYLGGIERAQRNPSLKVLTALADALGVSVIELLSEKPD